MDQTNDCSCSTTRTSMHRKRAKRRRSDADIDSPTARGGLTAYVLLGPVAEHLPPVLQVVQPPALAAAHPEDHRVPTLPRLPHLALVREWVGDGLGEELEAVAVAELVWMRQRLASRPAAPPS